MKESFHNYFQMGIVHAMAFPETGSGDGPIVETVRRIAEDDYFDAVELPYIPDPVKLEQVKKVCETAHLAVGIAGQPRLLSSGSNINDLDEEKRLAAVELIKECIDQADYLGAKAVAYLSGKYEEDKFEAYYGQLVKSAGELCEYAGQKGIRTLVEVFDYDVDKKSIIGPVATAKRFAEEMRANYDNFGLLVDLSHMPLLRESPAESMTPVRDYIEHLHVGNAVCKEGLEGYGDLHPRFGFPGSSVDAEELKEFLETALKLGLIGGDKRPFLSFEVKPWKDEEPELVIANAKRTMNLAWGEASDGGQQED